jgi:hypothetical protein
MHRPVELCLTSGVVEGHLTVLGSRVAEQNDQTVRHAGSAGVHLDTPF